MHLLDTEVVWELRSSKDRSGDGAVVAWAAKQSRTSMFISALTLVELGRAAQLAERRDKTAGLAIRRWIDGSVTAAFDKRVLPADVAVARRASALPYDNAVDAMLAATALEHGLTIATRHPAIFRLGRVRVFNPWRYAPDQPEPVDDDADWRQASRNGPFRLRNLFSRG